MSAGERERRLEGQCITTPHVPTCETRLQRLLGSWCLLGGQLLRWPEVQEDLKTWYEAEEVKGP